MSRVAAHLLVVVALLAVLVTPASGNVSVTNEMLASFTKATEGTQVYRYGSGTDHTFDNDAGFSTGVLGGDARIEDDTVELAPDDDWWDTDWQHRQCFDFKASDSLDQYPFRIEVDTSLASADDLRVVEHLTPAAGAVPVPHFVESGLGSTTTVVWFQGEASSVRLTRYCVYFGSGEPSTSSATDPFSYNDDQAISYYTMLDTYRGSSVDSQVDVISYSDGNVISDGTTTVVRNTGQIATFSGLDEHSVITATGPIDASYNRPSKEALIPEAFADNRFSFPTRRYVERFWVRSPHGPTEIEAVANGVVLSTTTVTPAMGAVEIVASGPSSQYVSLRSTDGTDFLAVHSSTSDQDIFIGVPWFGDDLVGVASQNLNLGALVPTTVAWRRSDGVSNASQPVDISVMQVIGSNGQYGNGRAYVIESADYVAAGQQADRDGTEMTSFLPRRLLSTVLRLPIAGRYYAIACPTPGTLLTVDSGPAVPCDGNGVGHYWSGTGGFAAGTLIEASEPIFVYYESSADEHSVFGPKASIPYLEDHGFGSDPVETLGPLCGSWTSPPVNVAGVLGLVDIDITVDPGQTYRFQIEFDGGGFVGPDGTSSTSFGPGDYIPYQFDGSAVGRIQVEFCGAGSHLNAVSFECDLVESGGWYGLPVPPLPVEADGPILRVYPNLDRSHIELVGASGADYYELTTDRSGVQIQAIAGVVTNPAPEFASEPYSVLLVGSSPQMGTLEARLVDEGDVRIETDVAFDFNIS